jgi:ppGpp synthetase/RelA/SpoT-type nucleotidyltranferase
MKINRDNIEKEYLDSKVNFDRIATDIYATLKRVANKYFNETRFQVYIPPLRIKTVPSIIGKLERKNRQEESLFSADGHVLKLVTNDFIGGRILCNTQEDVVAIEKIIANYPRLTIEKRELINKENGYSALHLDIYYETYWEDSTIKIPLELQIKITFSMLGLRSHMMTIINLRII